MYSTEIRTAWRYWCPFLFVLLSLFVKSWLYELNSFGWDRYNIFRLCLFSVLFLFVLYTWIKSYRTQVEWTGDEVRQVLLWETQVSPISSVSGFVVVTSTDDPKLVGPIGRLLLRYLNGDQYCLLDQEGKWLITFERTLNKDQDFLSQLGMRFKDLGRIPYLDLQQPSPHVTVSRNLFFALIHLYSRFYGKYLARGRYIP